MTISQPATPGTALWVSAHARRDSLGERIFHEGTRALAESHTVLTSDLYAQNFDPVLRESDLGQLAGTDGNFAELLGEAYTAQQLPDDVRAEQRKVAEAELLVFQFPLWWYGMPAMLKGWLDRVLTAGFAHGDIDEQTGLPLRYGDGGLSGRTALILVTAGDDARTLGPRGISGDLDALLFPLTHGALWYTGVASLPLHAIYDADEMSADTVEVEMARLRERLSQIGSERPQRYRRLQDNEYRGTRALHTDLAPGRTDLGIHLASS